MLISVPALPQSCFALIGQVLSPYMRKLLAQEVYFAFIFNRSLFAGNYSQSAFIKLFAVTAESHSLSASNVSTS